MGRFDELLNIENVPTSPPQKEEVREVERKMSVRVPVALKKAPLQSTSGKENAPVAPQEEVNQSDEKESNYASTLASYQDSTIADIRALVRQVGRETSFIRLTPEEKQQLSDLVYTHKRQGIRTSENEVCRIALNYLLRDFKESGDESVLARVLKALYS